MARLLFVDDEPAPLAFSQWLEERGHDVLRADNVADAIAYIASQVFDVIVVDMMLPSRPLDILVNLSDAALREEVKNQRLAGLRVFDAILSAPRPCPVVFHSAYPEYVVKNAVDTSQLHCSFVRRHAGAQLLCDAVHAALSHSAH